MRKKQQMSRNKRLREEGSSIFSVDSNNEKVNGVGGIGEESGVKSRFKRAKKFVFNMFTPSRPRPPFG